MTEPMRERGSDGSTPAQPQGMPRWVRTALIIAAIVFLLAVIVKVTGLGGEHGPGRHGAGEPFLVAEAGSAAFEE